MFADGVIEEVRACGEPGSTASQTIGLCEIRALLAGEIDHVTCLAAIQQSTRRYAKRQMTWFRRETALIPLDLTGIDDFSELAKSLADKAAN